MATKKFVIEVPDFFNKEIFENCICSIVSCTEIFPTKKELKVYFWPKLHSIAQYQPGQAIVISNSKDHAIDLLAEAQRRHAMAWGG